MSNVLEGTKVLLLQVDEWTPLAVIDWKRAIELIFSGKVKIIEESDRTVSSVSISMKVPSIIALRKYIHIKPKVKFSKFNVFARDDYHCQYCNRELEHGSEMTLDHVIPRSQGGITEWNNVVLACRKCNHAKGGRTPKQARMKLLCKPCKPNYVNWVTVTFAQKKNLPELWGNYCK